MPTDAQRLARRLFEGVMAPLVLGGTVEPGHAIGARAALALEETAAEALDPALLERVQAARVRGARRLAPIDALALPSSNEWALAAALHDVLHAANPSFDAVGRRGAAAHILEVATQTLDRVPPPAHVGEALSRHTWFRRLLEVERRDTQVTWWTGSQTFRGVEPPSRLRAWPELRRVSVATTRLTLLDVAPLAIERDRLAAAVTAVLGRTPLTDLATCWRPGPPFTWEDATLALVASPVGRRLALRALRAMPAAQVDGALGDATRALVVRRPAAAAPALTLLADRALAAALLQSAPEASPPDPAVDFARALGAAGAMQLLEGSGAELADVDRRRVISVLAPIAASQAAHDAVALAAGRA